MEKIDFRLERRDLYAPSPGEFSVVDVPPLQYFAVDGAGDPNTSTQYTDAVEALYAVSYAAKFASKRELGRDYVVAPLEGLWTGTREVYTEGRRDHWTWTILIRQPDWLSDELRAGALETASKKELPGVPRLRFTEIAEGLSVQILHLGSYADEAPTIARLHDEFLPEHGYVENGAHHEIYLNDPRRVEATKLKTVLRQPVRQR